MSGRRGGDRLRGLCRGGKSERWVMMELGVGGGGKKSERDRRCVWGRGTPHFWLVMVGSTLSVYKIITKNGGRGVESRLTKQTKPKEREGMRGFGRMAWIILLISQRWETLRLRTDD